MIKSISKDDSIRNFPKAFSDGIVIIEGPHVAINLKKDAKLDFLKSRPVLFALKKAIYL